MDKKTAIVIIRQFISVFESKKEFEWLVKAMIFIDKLVEDQTKEIEDQQKEIEEYQKCFEDIERHQKNQMQMQKELWKRLKGEINE